MGEAKGGGERRDPFLSLCLGKKGASSERNQRKGSRSMATRAEGTRRPTLTNRSDVNSAVNILSVVSRFREVSKEES